MSLSERPDILLVTRIIMPDGMPLSLASCCAVAAFAWVLHDHALTLRDEVAFVWRQKIRYAAFLFFWVRYMGLFLVGALLAMNIFYESRIVAFDEELYEGWASMADMASDALWLLAPLFQFAVFWVVEVILQCRIHALYGSWMLATFNAVFFLGELAAMFFLWILHPDFSESCAEGTILLSPTSCGYSVPVYWIPAIVFELWLAALAFRKLGSSWGSDLFTLVVQDSIKYFALVAVVMVAHFVSAFYQVDGLVLSFLVAGQTIGGSRLVLQLRKAYYEGPDNGHGTTLAAGGVRRGISTIVDESFYAPQLS
ncbi:hypothetical protein EXIGLDRAFT_841012 [Exidia glandulosa HHB12029]|uniref:DUF6533 domain-containing protein n=1 Tax=Exidia glandulosa HHB12029 TaxID=1314781 RepID=A0A165E5H2_EXIGL|nr:hypothetical protein EXIGLDRAFT_841012 [Exidia glandulosa HHB12029]